MYPLPRIIPWGCSINWILYRKQIVTEVFYILSFARFQGQRIKYLFKNEKWEKLYLFYSFVCPVSRTNYDKLENIPSKEEKAVKEC